MRRFSFKIMLLIIFKNILKRRAAKEYGAMMWKFKHYLRYMADRSKSMQHLLNPLELFTKIINIKLSLLDLHMSGILITTQ